MQVFHGTIITCDENNTVANYLVEREGRIAYIGDTLPTQYEVVPPIELGSNVALPAFVDTHTHYSGFSVLHRMFPISDTDSNAKILEQLDKCEKESGNIVPLSATCIMSVGNEMVMLFAGNLERVACPNIHTSQASDDD